MEDSLENKPSEPIEGVLKELYTVMRQDISFEEKAQQSLEIGQSYLGAENGHLTQIDPETNHREVIVSTDSPDGQHPAGLETKLNTTYCRRVFEKSSQLALHDISNQGQSNDPAYENHGIHCYMGTPLHVNDELYGTVCFVSSTPRDTPYSESEKLLAELIAHMLERELEYNQFETQLTKQTNLTLVLNRVLRHNLRNEMSVVRGYTQMMSDRLDKLNVGETALQSIDKIINLSEKARKLDKVIASDQERNQTNIQSVISNVVEDIHDEYPSASISTDINDDIAGNLSPSFRRAVWELMENAAKHSGEHPNIKISAEMVPNAVEIRIADDGPGLNDEEIKVIHSGSETPLTHGSGLGLWMAHWIVSLHDGSLEASVTEEGTTLTINVPHTPSPESGHQMRELVRAKDQYKAAFDEAGDGMTITDDDARILDINDEAAQILGMTRQELLGRSMQEFLPSDFDFESEWGEIKTSNTKRGQLQITTIDKEISILEYTAKTDVVPGQHLIISRDITEKIEREQQLERLKEAVENAGHAIFFTDTEGTIEYVNPAFERITEYSADTAIGKTPNILNSGEMADVYFENLWETIQAGESWEEKVINEKKSGEKYTAVQTISPITNDKGELTGHVAVQSDITQIIDATANP